MLKITDLTVRYGGITALSNVSLHIQKGEVVALIGSNSSGKSTLLQAVMATVPLSGGRIELDDYDISGARTIDIVRAGISFVPETRDIFPAMSVRDNLRLGLFIRDDEHKFDGLGLPGCLQVS